MTRLDCPTRWLLASVLTWLVACQPKPDPMNPEEAQRVAKITERMTTRCVGRYLIDLPEKFVLNSQWVAEIEGVRVDVRPMTRWRFDNELAEYRGRLDRTRLPLNGLPYVRSVTTIENGVVFDRAASTASTGRASRQLEAWTWQDGYKVQSSIGAFDGTFPEDADSKFHREQGSDVSQKLAELLRVHKRIRGHAESQIPNERGFCIANGFVSGPSIEEEETSIAFHLEGAPDVYFNVTAIKESIKEKERLLQRSAKVEREMSRSGTQTLRKGEVEHGGMKFDEWLFKGPTPERVPGTMFMLVGNESMRGLEHPFIRMELLNGFRVPAPERSMEESAQLKDLERATLSEAEAVAIWDQVAPTVRLRPGAL